MRSKFVAGPTERNMQSRRQFFGEIAASESNLTAQEARELSGFA